MFEQLKTIIELNAYDDSIITTITTLFQADKLTQEQKTTLESMIGG